MAPKKKRRVDPCAALAAAGSASEQGPRAYQEDRVAAAALDGGDLVAVLDGHGGAGCAQFAAARFPEELRRDLEAGLPPECALVNATYATEVAWFRAAVAEEDTSGTTLVAALIVRGPSGNARRVLAANVGDSRCLVVPKDGPAVPLTIDQDAKNAAERQRMKAAGGTVDEDGYINGAVQTARSLGDADAKWPDMQFSAAVVPTPAIETRKIEKTDVAVVLGCDGLFEARGGTAWIAKLVRAGAAASAPAADVAKALVQQALDDGSGDNTTAVVVLL